MNANTIWKESGSRPEFPVNGTVWERLNYAVKCAGMAVGMQEWQPWHFRIKDGAVELSGRSADHSMTAAGGWHEQDEASLRQVIIRCGVALFNLRLALKNFGCLGKVELFPDLAESGLIARVYHSGAGSAGPSARVNGSGSPVETELFRAMNAGQVPLNEHSSPASGQTGRGVDGELLEAFEERLGFDAADKAWLEFAGCEASYERLVALASQTRSQSARGNGWLTFIVRAGDRNSIRVETDGRRAEDMAALGMIKTKTDDRHGWLAAGQALAKAVLQARAWQVTSQVFDQSFSDRKLREILRTSIGHKGYVQAILGVGTHRAGEVDGGWWMVDGTQHSRGMKDARF